MRISPKAFARAILCKDASMRANKCSHLPFPLRQSNSGTLVWEKWPVIDWVTVLDVHNVVWDTRSALSASDMLCGNLAPELFLN